MFKKMMIVALLFAGFTSLSATEANAWIVRRRIAPVRRAARVVLPPYRRRVVVAPRVVARPVVVAPRPVVYARPAVSVGVGVGFGGGGYYGW